MKKRAKKTILITKYNRRWPAIYNREKGKILAAIGNQVLRIEHIGSTSVIGLAAKPVIDIIVAIKSLDLTKELIEPLRRIRYKYEPKYEVKLPDRRFFHRGPSETTGAMNRHFHVHIVEKDSAFWHDHILFRDYLRRHQEVARKYEELKKKLAVTCRGDINCYCENKSGFIKKVIRWAKRKNKKRILPTIRKFKAEDAMQVAKLIIKTFNDQVGRKLPINTKKRFLQGNTLEKILKFSKVSDIFVAKINSKIVGVIAGLGNERIVRLFVDKKFQGQGIAKVLMHKIEDLYKARGAKTIHIRSSLYALNFYIRMGYKKATRLIHDKHGMVYQPVIKKL